MKELTWKLTSYYNQEKIVTNEIDQELNLSQKIRERA